MNEKNDYIQKCKNKLLETYIPQNKPEDYDEFWDETIEKLKNKNIWVYSLEAGNTLMYDVDMTGPLALVIGSEGEGVSRLVNKTCDGTISIPLKGQVNSLNASNAGAIAMYEVLRQREICRK